MIVSLILNYIFVYPGKWLLKLIIGKNRFPKVKDNKALFCVFGGAAIFWIMSICSLVLDFSVVHSDFFKGWLIFDILFPIGCLILAIVERKLPPVIDNKSIVRLFNDDFQILETLEKKEEQTIFVLRVTSGKKHYDYKFVESFREKCTADEFIENCKKYNYEGAEVYLERLKTNKKFIEFIEQEQKQKENKVIETITSKIDNKEPSAGQIKCPHCGKVQREDISRCLGCGKIID